MVIFREFLTLEDTYDLRHLTILRATLLIRQASPFQPRACVRLILIFTIALPVHLAVRAERAGHILAFAVRAITRAALFCVRALSASWEEAIDALMGVWGAETGRAAVAVDLAASVGGATLFLQMPYWQD